MSSPKCTDCGRGLSAKHRAESADALLFMAIFDINVCVDCLAKRAPHLVANYNHEYSDPLWSQWNGRD